MVELANRINGTAPSRLLVVDPAVRPPAARTTGECQLVDPIADGRWEQFIASDPAACVFHHTAWLALLRRTYGYPLTACCVVGRGGEIRAGAPLVVVDGLLRRRRRLSCVPFSDHCTPLPAPAREPELADQLVCALDDMRLETGMPVELRGPAGDARPSHVVARYRRHHVPLEADVDAVVRRFRRRSQLLRGARRAAREGLVAERRTDVEALADFYRLHVATRRRLGVPTHPRRFILGFARLFDRGLGFVLLVRDGQRPIAAGVFLAFNGTLIYKYGASDASSLAKRPNNLLFLEAISWGCRAGMHSLDLGRTDWDHQSLREFKLSWGAEERTLEYRHLGAGQDRVDGSRIARRAGPVIRHSPAFVGRLVGEALYRVSA